MSEKQLFHLQHMRAGETVALVEIDLGLLKEVIDEKTGTLRELRHGANYTVVPISRKEPLLDLLRGLRRRYQEFQEPAKSLVGMLEKADSVVQCAGMLFRKIEYIVVRDRTDLQALVHPGGHHAHEFQRSSYAVLDGVCDELAAEIAAEQEKAAASFNEEGKDHECTEHCDH